MKKIKTAIRVAAISDLTTRIDKSYKNDSSVSKDSALKSMMARAVEVNATLITALKHEALNSRLDVIDSARDRAIRAIFRLVEAYTCMDEHAENAIEVQKIISKYGMKIQRLAYAEESAHIESMLEELYDAKNIEAVSALPQCAEALKTLREAQTQFNNVRVDYQKEVSERVTTASAIELKKSLLYELNGKIIPYLTAMSATDAKTYGKFASTIEIMISEANTLIDQRKTSASSTDVQTDESTETDDEKQSE